MSSKSLVAAAALAVAALVIVPIAAADQVFHTSHAAVHSVAGAPLRSGFVNDIHTNGAVNSAHEEYHLNGAQANTTYQVQLLLFNDQSCGGTPFAIAPTAQLTTNGQGNGNADFTFPAGAPNNPPLQVGIIWQFLSSTGDPVYATDCVPVSID
ncbi:MAG TPA: hypothetical protein VFB17_03105 [Gaiellaceae bacterium]|nr:hypothetical protein [Gaiellaceae bacterium]